MKILVKVKPQAKEEKVQQLNGGRFVVWVKAPAKEGRANAALIKALSNYFAIAKSRIAIIKGHAAREKVVVVEK